MMKVQFHDVEEYLAEMERDAEQMHRLILRVAVRRKIISGWDKISVIAGYRIGDSIVCLEKEVGNGHYLDENAMKEFAEKANQLRERLQSTARGHRLEVRSGYWE